MAKTISDTLRETLTQVAREAIGNIGGEEPQKAKGGLSSGKGLLAGVGLAAAAPLAKKAVDALRDGSVDELIAELRERVEAGAEAEGQPRAKGDEAEEQPRAEGDEGGEGQAQADDEPGGEEDGDERQPSGGPTATGKGRRMPVQQAVDVGVPLETAYNHFTRFEDWPEFMHRVTRVTQEDDCSISFATKIWGKTKEFKASIETQRPEERIKWKVSQGITHAGVVTFHELAPNLTRIEVTLDIEPGSLIEKAARGMRHVKRAVRADLARFKAFIEMQERETGAWRGVIVDGELVEPHDESYDEERDYSEIEAEGAADQEDAQAETEAEEADEEPGEDEEPTAQEDEEEGGEQPQRRAKSPRARRSRTVSANGHGKPERVGSGGGRRSGSRFS
jgi:uncharacterized membrane protein